MTRRIFGNHSGNLATATAEASASAECGHCGTPLPSGTDLLHDCATREVIPLGDIAGIPLELRPVRSMCSGSQAGGDTPPLVCP